MSVICRHYNSIKTTSLITILYVTTRLAYW